MENSDAAAPRGTLVVGHLRKSANADELRRYLQDFVRFVPTAITFNGQKISQTAFSDHRRPGKPHAITAGTQEWRDGDLVITGRSMRIGDTRSSPRFTA